MDQKRRTSVDVSIIVALISGALLLFGQFMTTMLPIISSPDTGDFYITVNPVPIVPSSSPLEYLPKDYDNWSKISAIQEASQANITVQNINNLFRKYNYPVFLR